MATFKKTTPTCSNIYLIDQNLCLGNSLNTINYNFSSLNTALSSLEKYHSSWYSLYTTFVAYSSLWIKTASNIQSFSAKWIDTTNTVSALNSRWTKTFTLYYPKMLNINTWYSWSTLQKNNLIITWLQTNFNPKNYGLDQGVEVLIYLTQEQDFTFSFNRSYSESCTPNGGGLTLSCTGNCPRPSRGCNHHGGRAGYGPCTNAYNACGVRSTSTPVSVSCVGTGGRQLSIGLNRQSTDKNIARTVLLKFKNTGEAWISI